REHADHVLHRPPRPDRRARRRPDDRRRAGRPHPARAHGVRAPAVAPLALGLVAPAWAGGRPSAAAIETKLVCPVCHETLDQSTAPVAQAMKALTRRRIAQGWTQQQILDEMIA